MQQAIVKESNHNEDFNILLEEVKKQIDLSGVIHIGAHKGEEVPFYLHHGIQNIVLIEANPRLYRNLCENFQQDNIKVFNCAISDKNEQLTFHVHTSRSGSVEAASILRMKEFSKIVKTMHTPESYEVDGKTLDALIIEQHIDIKKYNILALDVQGAELHALRGAINNISAFDAIICEVNLLELYEGAALEKDIVAFLENFGFAQQFTIYHQLYNDSGHFNAWGESIFIRENAKLEKAR